MPRKLKNGKYEFKGGCIGETDEKGNFVIVKTVRRKKEKKKKIKKDTKKNKKVQEKVQEKEKKVQKKRRSEKKQFSKKSPQNGGEQSNLDINVHMLREFYLKNF
jgi:hypothetical protein